MNKVAEVEIVEFKKNILVSILTENLKKELYFLIKER